ARARPVTGAPARVTTGMRSVLCLVLILAAALAAKTAQAGGGERYIYWKDKDSVNMSGDVRDLERVRAQVGAGPALWFTRAGSAYLVRDPKVLARVDELFRPMQELGEKQGILGRHQSNLGARQGELGARQGVLGQRLAHLSMSGRGHD